MQLKKDICLYTLSYPAGLKETSVHTELQSLAQATDRIYIFHQFENEDYRKVPKNVEVINPFKKFNYQKKNVAASLSFLRKNINLPFLKDAPYQINFHNRLIQKAQRVKEILIEKELTNHLHYIYWFDEWASILALVKKELPELRIVARAHGFDLLNKRSRVGYFPHRKLQLNAVEKVFAVSQQGCNYLKQNFLQFEKKIERLYLGTNALKINTKVPQEMHFLSISNMISIKRIDRIMDALMGIEESLFWTHFGDGELRPQLEDKIKKLPSNVVVNFKGHASNEKVLNFIQNESISCFINVSETEGLPLSMMEVQSAGIPIIATNVGGVAEIVNEKTGILLDKNFETEELRRCMIEFKNHILNKAESRKAIRQFWANNFDAEKNFKTFASYLQTLN